MRLKYNDKYNTFYCECHYYEKEIPKSAGFLWSKNRKVWYTVNPSIALELIQYGDSKVLEKIDKLKERTLTAVEESLAKESNIDVPCPDGLAYLPFQKAGIAYALKRNNTLIADEMGLGKTIETIGVINASPLLQKILICCPATMKYKWKAELEKWLVKDFTISVWSTKEQVDADIIILNYDLLKRFPYIRQVPFSLVVGDEIHFCKTKPKTTKDKKTGKNKDNRSKVFYEVADRAIKRLYLTGTPILNRPAELYYMLESLQFPMSWYNFMTRYAEAYKDDYGYWNTKGASNLNELQEKLRTHVMIRRLKKEVLPELPDKFRQIVELSDEKLVKAVLKEEHFLTQRQELISEIKDKIKEAKETKDKKSFKKAVKELKEFHSDIFTELAEIRHNTALKKVPYAIEYIKGLLESTNKLVVFAHHRDVLEKMYKAFEKDSIILTGDTPPENRYSMEQEFQTDPNCKIFFASIKAGGIGLTLTASSTVVFIEGDWTPSIISQAEDRCHRYTQENSVNIKHLVVNGSIDSKIAKMCVAKQEVITEALDEELDEELDIFDIGEY